MRIAPFGTSFVGRAVSMPALEVLGGVHRALTELTAGPQSPRAHAALVESVMAALRLAPDERAREGARVP